MASILTHQRPVVVVDDDVATLAYVNDVLHGSFPEMPILATPSVRPSLDALLETGPPVVITGLDPRGLAGCGLLRRVERVAPEAHRILITDKRWQRGALQHFRLLAALRRPPDPDTLVDLVGGLVYGRAEVDA